MDTAEATRQRILDLKAQHLTTHSPEERERLYREAMALADAYWRSRGGRPQPSARRAR